MSVFAARMNPSSSDWLSLGDGRYSKELRHHQHHQQLQQQQLTQATSSPPQFRDADICVKPDPDSVYLQRTGESLNVDESYRAATRVFSQHPGWQTSPQSYHVATQESRRLPSGVLDNSLGWPLDRQRFPDCPRDVTVVASRPNREEGDYIGTRVTCDKEDFGSDRRSFGGGPSPAGDSGHGPWTRDPEQRHQSPQQQLDSAVGDPYRTAPGHHRPDTGGLRLERAGDPDDDEPGHYRPRQLLADFYRTRERPESQQQHQRETREEPSGDDGLDVEGRRWIKAASAYNGSPPAERESIEVTNFYNGRRQTWPLASLQDHLGVPGVRRRYPHNASADQYFDDVDRSLGRQQAAVAAAAAASPILQLIQRYDQHGLTSSASDRDAIPPSSSSSGVRADWAPLPWQSTITSAATSAAVDSNSTSEMLASVSESGDANKTYSCHICSYFGDSKAEFDAHMRLHFDHRCPFCDYSSRTEGRLRCHIKTFHADGGLATGQPQLPVDQAAKRKPKTITCQKCGFKAKEKEELWIHRRQQHMSADKVLECPRCPFATELRHHLEYHLRSHYGSRPYKCDKCTYRCYNQSMLNSHAKSHTNVYQFRCSDCQFAAKYCHSLKVHLRQNPTHRAAPVLNEDGSVPTDGSGDFEVISRRGRPRGPRASRRVAGTRSRLSRPDMAPLAAPLPALSMPMSTGTDAIRSVVPPAQYAADNARSQFSGMPNYFATDDSRLSSSSPSRLDAAGRMFPGEMRLMPTAFGEFVANQASRHGGQFQTGTSTAVSAGFQMRSEQACQRDEVAYSSVPPFVPVHMSMFESSGADEHVGGPGLSRPYSPATCAGRPVRPTAQSTVLASASAYDDYGLAVVSPSMPEPEPALCGDLPLDLTAKSRTDDEQPASEPQIRPEVSERSPDDVTAYRRRRHYESWSRAHTGATTRPHSDDPTLRDRKDSDGADSAASVAGDLKPEVNTGHAQPEPDNFGEPKAVLVPELAGPPAKRTRATGSVEDGLTTEMESGSPASATEGSVVGGRYQCSHCEIEFFGSRVLHAMHMAFHGPVDPFQCSQCGVRTADRVDFFLHLARVAHA